VQYVVLSGGLHVTTYLFIYLHGSQLRISNRECQL